MTSMSSALDIVWSSEDDISQLTSSKRTPAAAAEPMISSKPPLPQPRPLQQTQRYFAAPTVGTSSPWKHGYSSPTGQPRHRTGHGGIATGPPDGALAIADDFIPTRQSLISPQFVNAVAAFDPLAAEHAEGARPTQTHTSADRPISTSAITLSSLPVPPAVERDAVWRREDKSTVEEAANSANSRLLPPLVTSSAFELLSSASAAAPLTELSTPKQRQNASPRRRHLPFRHGVLASRTQQSLVSAVADQSPPNFSSLADVDDVNLPQLSPTSVHRQVAPQSLSVNDLNALRHTDATRLTSADESHAATVEIVADRKWRATLDGGRRRQQRVLANENFSSSATGGASWSDASGSSSNPALRTSASFDLPQRSAGNVPPPTARASSAEAGSGTLHRPTHIQPDRAANTSGWSPPPSMPALLEAYGPDAWKPPPPPQPVTGGERDQAMWYESHPPDMKSYALFACCVLVACNALFGAVALVIVVYSIALISTGEYKRAEQYGRASMWVAVAGICVTFVIALVLLISSAAGGF